MSYLLPGKCLSINNDTRLGSYHDDVMILKEIKTLTLIMLLIGNDRITDALKM